MFSAINVLKTVNCCACIHSWKKALWYLEWSRSTRRESAKLHHSVLAQNVAFCSELNDVSLTSQLVSEINEIWWDIGKQGQWPPPVGKDSSTRNFIAGNNGVIIEQRILTKWCPFFAGRDYRPTNLIAVYCLTAVANPGCSFCLPYTFLPLDATKSYKLGL